MPLAPCFLTISTLLWRRLFRVSCAKRQVEISVTEQYKTKLRFECHDKRQRQQARVAQASCVVYDNTAMVSGASLPCWVLCSITT